MVCVGGCEWERERDNYHIFLQKIIPIEPSVIYVITIAKSWLRLCLMEKLFQNIFRFPLEWLISLQEQYVDKNRSRNYAAKIDKNIFNNIL